MDKLTVDDMTLDGELFDGEEIYIFCRDHDGEMYLNKEESIKVINHLLKVFEIDRFNDLREG